MRSGALLALAAVCAAQTPRIPVESFSLPNGLRVALQARPGTDTVHLNIRIGVGAAAERPGRTGFAHLFEHMLGQGVDAGTDFSAELDKLGASGASGEAKHDYIEFYETVPSGRLERLLWMEARRFGKLPEAITQANFDKQREIVRNERRLKVENAPGGRMNMLIHRHSFPEGHPYGHDVIGSHADLLAATLDDVREFHRDHYTPDNASLVLVGGFDPAAARRWISKYYGAIAPGRGIAKTPHWLPKLGEPKSLDLFDRVPRTTSVLTWPVPGLRSAAHAPFELAAVLLGEGSAEVLPFEHASLFVMQVAPDRISHEEAEAKISREIADLARDGPGADEMTRARNNVESRELAALDSLYGTALALQNAAMFLGSPARAGDWVSRHAKVTADDVKRAAREWLDTPNRVTVRLRPEKSEQGPKSSALDEPAPAFGAEARHDPPVVKESKLANGLRVLVSERRALPLVSVRLKWKAGMAHAPAGLEGLGPAAVSAMKRGTATRDAAAIDKELRALAVTVSASADADSLSMGFDVLTRNLGAAMDLLGDFVLRPTFGERRFDDDKKEWLEIAADGAARADNTYPAALAVLFGRGHPFGRPVTGTEASVLALSAPRAADFYKRHLRPDNAALVLVGDLAMADAVKLAERTLGGWSGSAEPAPPVPDPSPAAGRVFLIERPGAAQTHVMQVTLAVPANHPDYAALALADKVRGGVFASRLMQRIRQQLGIAYFASSELSPMGRFGVWTAFASVQADKTTEALAEFDDQVRKLVGDRPITAEELAMAKQAAIRAEVEAVSSTSALADVIALKWARGISVDWRQTPDLDAVNAAVRRHLGLDKRVFITTGDRAVVERAAEANGLGPVTRIRYDGSPVR